MLDGERDRPIAGETVLGHSIALHAATKAVRPAPACLDCERFRTAMVQAAHSEIVSRYDDA
jgi:hypothetical protein